jgi:hypothetical protein
VTLRTFNFHPGSAICATGRTNRFGRSGGMLGTNLGKPSWRSAYNRILDRATTDALAGQCGRDGKLAVAFVYDADLDEASDLSNLSTMDLARSKQSWRRKIVSHCSDLKVIGETAG